MNDFISCSRGFVQHEREIVQEHACARLVISCTKRNLFFVVLSSEFASMTVSYQVLLDV